MWQCCTPDILRVEGFSHFQELSEKQLVRRLDEERQRASAIDEKTFKLTLSLSAGITILGLMAAFLANAVLSAAVQAITIIIGIGLFYILVAGFVAVGALRTLPSYGYGTHFLLQRRENEQVVLADALARQEIMNRVRHLRNETAYQTLRNGLLLIFVGIIIFTVMLIFQLFYCTN